MKSKRSNKPQNNQSEINEQTTKIQNASEIQEEKTLTKKEIEEKIRMIFLNLAKYSSLDNQYYISQQTVNKLLKEMSLIPESPVLIGEIDILFKKVNPNNNKLNCEQFLNFLVKLVQKMFPDEFKKNRIGTMNNFLFNFFESCNNLSKENYSNLSLSYQMISEITNISPNNEQMFILKKIAPSLKEIYLKYFSTEINNSNSNSSSNNKSSNNKKGLNNLIIFARDFEIYPYIITQNQLITYYNIITSKPHIHNKETITFNIDTSNNNAHFNYNNNHDFKSSLHNNNKQMNYKSKFTLEIFYRMIVHFSIISYMKNNNYNINKDEEEKEVIKLLLFLEILENSKGIKHFISQLNKPSSKNISLIPDKSAVFKVLRIKETFDKDNNNIISLKKESSTQGSNNNNNISNTQRTNTNNNHHHISNNETSNKDISELNIKRLYTNITQRSLEDINNIIQSNLTALSKTFLYFCRKGDKLKYEQLSLLGFIEFLKHCQLIKPHIPNANNQDGISSHSENSDKTKHSNNNNNGMYKNVENELGETTKKYLFPETNQLHKKDNTSSHIQQQPQDKKTNLNNIIKQTEIIGKISPYEIDMIYSKITGQNKNMDFILFIKSFQLISQYAYPKSDKSYALKNVLISNIIPNLIKELTPNENELDSEVSAFHFAFTKLKDENVKYFLKKLSLYLVTYYTLYCDKLNNMSFENFFAFYKDFALFPDVINLIQLRNLFYFLSNYDDNITALINGTAFITFTNLVEAIAICAVLSDYDEEFTDIDKLIYIVEKMVSSNGINKCQSESGRTL